MELTDHAQRRQYLEQLVTIFQKDIRNESIVYRARVHLDGIIVSETPIQMSVSGVDVTLQRPVAHDLEREDLYRSDGFWALLRKDPSAILLLELSSTDRHLLQKLIYQSVAILRLYKVGSVHEQFYTMGAESLAPLGGTVSTLESHLIVERYAIEDGEAPILRRFWKAISSFIPIDTWGMTGPEVRDYISIAYQRYSDALLKNGLLERQIANAIMGLEALYLTGNEKAELKYRLRMRVAKVLGLFGQNPYEAKKAVDTAYNVRSSFVHGDQIDKDTKKTVKQIYGGELHNVLVIVLEQLRISIILNLLVRSRGVGKDDLIRLVDDSFIDSRRQRDLKNLATPVKRLI